MAAGCSYHDAVCPEWFGLGCALFMGCGTQYGYKDWSYDTWLHAVTEYREAYDWGYYGQC
jgi:hypothetical protein